MTQFFLYFNMQQVIQKAKTNINGFDALFALKLCTFEDVKEVGLGLLAGHARVLLKYLSHAQISP